MERHGSATAVGMAELPVGTTLPDFREAVRLQEGDDFSRFQNWNVAHSQATWIVRTSTNSDSRFGPPVLQKHLDDLSEVVLKFIDVCSLRMGTWPTGHVTHQQPSVRVSLNYELERPHWFAPPSLPA
jgi:hypothetical protein